MKLVSQYSLESSVNISVAGKNVESALAMCVCVCVCVCEELVGIIEEKIAMKQCKNQVRQM